MNYYEVAPASRQYHGSSLLTYSSPEKLDRGQIIVVKIRSKAALAFVVREVAKPSFKTVEVDSSLPLRLPGQHVQLFEWLMEYYPAPLGLAAGLFLPFDAAKDYIAVSAADTMSKPAVAEGSLKDNETPATPKKKQRKPAIAPPPLTGEQIEAVKIAGDNKTVVLHGDTGTGKTRVYIELAQKTLDSGRSVLILVPEIALSPQIVKTFETYLNAPVSVTHSGLTTVKRRKTWQQIAGSEVPQVVIGPRSALFTPLANVGLVVVDEFHESAYKQDQAPYYQTLRAASVFARLHDARMVMGSATPPVSEYYIAEQKNVPIIRMQEKAVQPADTAKSKLHTILVNLRDEDERTRYPLVSKTLLEAIGRALDRKEQTLLFLNKRGSARLILCQSCGWHALCERCDLPLTYHGDSHSLQCHTCGFQLPAPSVCPSCSSHDIIFKSPGTKAIVEAVTRHFPDANIARFDRDNKKAERLETRHGEIMSGEIDILVGTQLLAKGHDLPRLSLVGILLAENELQFPDYTSSERSYQLMHQLIGRVGRGHRAGEVVVQTYDPANLAVQTALREQSWQGFYDAQIQERKLFEFPPFYYLMKIEVSRAKEATVMTGCEQIIDFLQQSGEPIKIIGPAPSFIEKRNNTYNWQIIVKAKQRTVLTRLAAAIPVKCIINLDPSNLL
jgi:primosomal protein N' (replication factor Y)